MKHELERYPGELADLRRKVQKANEAVMEQIRYTALEDTRNREEVRLLELQNSLVPDYGCESAIEFLEWTDEA